MCACRRAASTKTRIETRVTDGMLILDYITIVAGRHPLKQGLKLRWAHRIPISTIHEVAGRHPLKQGLKLHYSATATPFIFSRRAASTKTRIETTSLSILQILVIGVAGRHPLKQGLKHRHRHSVPGCRSGRRAASTKTRIETSLRLVSRLQP